MTLTNLTQLLGSVGYWGVFKGWLHIPSSVYLDIRRQHKNSADRVKGWCEWYVSHHPAPSWLHVAGALYHAREHNTLAVVKDKIGYLKGRSNQSIYNPLHSQITYRSHPLYPLLF
jgi:hypothetical protein